MLVGADLVGRLSLRGDLPGGKSDILGHTRSPGLRRLVLRLSEVGRTVEPADALRPGDERRTPDAGARRAAAPGNALQVWIQVLQADYQDHFCGPRRRGRGGRHMALLFADRRH